MRDQYRSGEVLTARGTGPNGNPSPGAGRAGAGNSAGDSQHGLALTPSPRAPTAERDDAPAASRRAGQRHQGRSRPDTRPAVGFIGAGRVGTALAQALHAAGYPVPAVASRSVESARTLAASIADCVAFEQPQQVADAADLIFITTPDDTISGVAGSIAWRPGTIVAHTSGALSLDVLQAAQDAGAFTGSLHPLQTFAAIRAPSLADTAFALEGDAHSLPVLRDVVEVLGGRAIILPPGAKTLYHLAAVLVSNYTVTLTKLATDLWATFGSEPETALAALLPLLRGTVQNLTDVGLPQALTGPIARGDTGTVERHLATLRLRAPDLLDLYRALGRETIAVAAAKGRLSDEALRELRRLLMDPKDAPP